MTVHRVTNVNQKEHGHVPSRLYVLSGEDAGAEVAIPPVGVIIGADESCNLKLKDPRVSRKHVAIVPGRSRLPREGHGLAQRHVDGRRANHGG